MGAGRPCSCFRQAAVSKTVVAAGIAKRQVELGEKVLFIAHRWELLKQAADKIKQVTGLDSGFEKAEMTSVGSMFPITVGSVQTLCRRSRLEKYDPGHFGTIIVDEAHHSVSGSFQEVLSYFEGAKVLGMTASIDRSDKRSLSEFFDSVAYSYSMRSAVKEGFLCPIKAKMIPLELDLKGVKMTLCATSPSTSQPSETMQFSSLAPAPMRAAGRLGLRE